MGDALRANPFQRAVTAVIYVDYDLMIERGILADAANAKLQKCKVVPGWDDDREHGVFALVRWFAGADQYVLPRVRMRFLHTMFVKLFTVTPYQQLQLVKPRDRFRMLK